jgi:predicted dehydrogenase
MSVAVIGAGRWGKNIVRTLHALGQLHSITDSSPEHRSAMAEAYPGVSIYERLEAALDSDARAVAIATPAQTHAEIGLAAIEAGKDVFIEKPITLNALDAERLVAAAANHGRILMAGHLLLFQPAVRWIKQAIDDGVIGDLYSLHQERLNLGRARAFENVLWSLGVHDVAVAQYLIGSAPVAVQSSGQAALQPGIEDDVYLHLEFSGGVMAHIHNSWLWPELRRRLTVVGSKGMLVYDESAQAVTLHRKRIDTDLANVDEGSEVVYEGAGEPLKLEMEHFLECVNTRTRPIADGAAALDVIRTLELAGGQHEFLRA